MGDPHPATMVVDAFLERQRAMYAGGPAAPVSELLSEEVIWHVPGASPIAGTYRGREAVLCYFARRRELPGGTMRIFERETLASRDLVLRFADGQATLVS